VNKNAKAWVKALVSRKYKQCKGTLKNEKGEFCCLGVATDLYLKAGNTLMWQNEEIKEIHPEMKTLPKKVADWLGMKGGEGTSTGEYGLDHSLADKNDKGAKFYQIARIIKRRAKELFV
jgi:hypothetical protein